MAAYDIAGRVALVTGAARGIGYESARLLHARGASVVLTDVDQDEVRAAGERIGGERTMATEADVTETSALEAAVSATVERFGGLDIVVANAGIAPPPRTVRVVDPEAYERVIEVDLLGVWRTVRAALPHVVERRGHVVVVASIYAFFNGALASPYAMSKAGVEQFGRALRVELAPHGASASVAYFGFIDTAMVRESFADPVAHQFEQTLPALFARRLPPSAAGEAIVRGIARRAPRIIAPRWWRAFSVLRGVVNPLFDARAQRDPRILELIREAERGAAGGDRMPAGRS